jgi:outer membrane protein TolC
MHRHHFPRFTRVPRCRILACLLALALMGFAAGCSQLQPTIARGAPQQSDYPKMLPDELPPPTPVAKVGAPVLASKQVPISLDTVFRLAESQNGQTAIARLKLNEAFANRDVANKAWMPDLWLGASWYRHDGGISNEDGTITRSSFNALFAGAELHTTLDIPELTYRKVEAEQRLWQQRAEVSKLNSEALMDASTTYIDFLAALAAQAVTSKVEGHLQDLLNQTAAIAKSVPAVEIDVSRVQAELTAEQQLLRKMREGSAAATAKLIYHLGLDPASDLVPMDRQLSALNLANVDVPIEELVAKALQNGPAVREMEGMLHLIHQAQEKSQGWAQYLPVFDLRVAEGGFGTGPDQTMAWDNRLDIGVRMEWNLTAWYTAREKQRANQAKIGQAHAAYQDLRAKLTMGVQEAREAVLSGRDQMDLAEKQLKYANDAYERSKVRLEKSPNVKDRSPTEVLLAIRSLNAAHLAYVLAIRDYDKAQLRLTILTGLVGRDGDH